MPSDLDPDLDHAGSDRLPLPGYEGRNDEEAARLLPIEQFDVVDDDDDDDDDDAGDDDKADPSSRSRSWLSGPSKPRRQTVKALVPRIQSLPIQAVDRLLPKTAHRVLAVAVLLLLWAAAFAALLLAGAHTARDASDRPLVNLDCTDSFWGSKNACGPDGVDCQPFSNVSFAFRCPPGCASVQLLEPRAIGPLEPVYRPLVVGTHVYRGDSWVCASAIHAGVFSNANGGCGRVTLVGQHLDYAGVEGQGGIRSIAFDSYFPLSFTLSQEPPSVGCAREWRGVLLLVSVLFTATLSISTVSPSLLFFVTMIVGLVHVGFVSDPPEAAFHNVSVLPDRISVFAERLLPGAFCLVVLYRTCVRPALAGLDAQFEKTVLWLGGFWFGALSNYTFGWLPIQRLTAHDLEQQPGAKASLAVILIILTLIVAQQVYYFWLEGRLLPYLGLYGLFIAAILVCLAIPSVELRLHHYIIGLLLLPGTSMQTRPSLLYQGLLLGLFVNGVARWGFASVLETPEALRGDGAFGSLTPAVIRTPSITLASVADAALSSISLVWEAPPPSAHMDGISVLVNDVERLRHFFTLDLSSSSSSSLNNFTWTRPSALQLPEYFRLAFIRDGVTLDYALAGTWLANGTWTNASHSL